MGERSVNNNNYIFNEIESDFDNFIKTIDDEFNPSKNELKSFCSQLKLDDSLIDDYFNHENILKTESSSKPDLAPCSICGRRFAVDRLLKHVIACEKIKLKKRQPFDSKAKRKVDGDNNEVTTTNSSSSDLNSLLNGNNNGSDDGHNGKVKNTGWREAHGDFIKTIRQSRTIKEPTSNNSRKSDEESTSSSQTTNSSRTTSKKPTRQPKYQPPTDTYDTTDIGQGKRVPHGHVMCPTCSRVFNRKSGERHIPWCAEKAKESSFRSPTPSDPDKLAKLKARVTYKKGQSNGSNASHKQPVIKSRANTGLRNGSNTSPPNSGVPSTSTLNGHSLVSGNRSPPTVTTRRTPTKSHVVTRHTQSVSPAKRTPAGPALVSRRSSPTMGNNGSVTGSRVKAQLIANERKLLPKTPVVKFKDKFPHHNYSGHSTSKYMEEVQGLKELFKRPDTLANFPRTVPGVRTGGMTPTGDVSSKSNGSSDGDIKKGLNTLAASSYSVIKKSLDNLYFNNEDRMTKSGSSTVPTTNNNHLLGNHHSISSFDLYTPSFIPINGGTRGSTSGSSDGGNHVSSAAVVAGTKNNGRESGDSMASSGKMPKWCHQCGTKYPMGMANYCYSCGARRLGSGSPFLIEPTSNKSF